MIFYNLPNISNYVHSKASLWENIAFQLVYEKQFLPLKPNFFPTHNDFLICTRDHDRDFWITAVLKLRVQSGVYWQISPGGGGTFYLFTCRKKLPNTLICGLQSRYLYLRLYITLNLDEIYQICDRCVISEYNIDLFGVFAWGRSSSVWLPGPSLASLHEMAQLS